MKKIFQINQTNPDINIIKKIGAYLRKGEIIVYPTDTVYGVGCDAYNIISIKKVYQIKERDLNKGFPILIGSIKFIKNFAQLNNIAKILIEKYWPGQLTIILNKKKKVPEIITGGQNTIAVRLPKNQITTLLAKEVKCGGIIGTSANLSGKKEPTTISEALDQLGDKIDYFIDGGVSEKKIHSTIVDVTVSPLRLIREGSVLFESIKKVIDIHYD
ncbi:MAG: L-threonylcarbamoyladenylate synthase [Candidatus Helarchaeota archaeon]